MKKYGSIKEVKENITNFLINETGDDSIQVIDVFKYEGGRSYQLTHYGLRNLKDHYTFSTLEIDFEPNIKNYSTLDSMIKGLYYIKPEPKEKHLVIHTTDYKFCNIVKLCNWNFELMVEKNRARLTKKK